MSGVNRVTILGRTGKDPEVRNLDNGATVANFTVAVSESYKDKTTGEKKETTEWFNCQAWRGLAEIVQKYVKKGDQIYLEGKLKTRSYEKDGITRYVTEVVVDQLQLLGNNRSNASTSGNNTNGEYVPAAGGGGNSSDDLSF